MPARQDPRLLVALGARVRALRAEAGLTQQELAERIAAEAATVNRIERGRVGVTITTLAALARGLGVGAGALVDFDSAAVPNPSTATEVELLDLFRRLDRREQEAVVGLARALGPRQD